MAGGGLGGAWGQGATPPAAGTTPGRTHLVIDDADLAAVREVRAVAASRVAELRDELADCEAELAVIDDALEQHAEAVRDG